MESYKALFKITVSIIWIFTHSIANGGGVTFSQEQVRGDMSNLYQSLIDTHYNPYAYISKAQLQQRYQNLQDQITGPSYSLLETTKLYQQLVSSLNNGHTEIDFPAAPYIEYAKSGGTLFPLEISIEGNKAFIRNNYSKNSSIVKGSELLKVNGQPINTILKSIYPLISAERQYFKNAKLEIYTLPRYYWYAYGRQDNFVVTIRNDDSITEYNVKAINTFDEFEAKKDEILDAQQKLNFFETTAYLNPGHFSGDEKKYQQFIDESFAAIRKKSSKNLIIDLRNNGGGNDSFSDYLVAYIADKPFRWSSTFSLRTSALLKKDTKANKDITKPYWQSVMNKKTGERYEFQFDKYQPISEKKRYKGNVYVLINRHSHSQAAVTAAQIQDYGWATIVGEETGDYPSLYASQFQYSLPITNIVVKISKGYIVRVSGNKESKGVIPDIMLRDHLLDENDEILTQLLQRF